MGSVNSGESDGAGAWQIIAQAQFVSLGTFRRNGELVATPVWLAADQGALVVTTEEATGKVKRLRRDERVELRTCSRFGAVDATSPTVSARAVIVTDPALQPTATEALRRKYGFQFTAFLTVEKILRRLQRRSGNRVILRITES